LSVDKLARFNLKNYSIEKFVPHSPPMVLIEKITHFDDANLTAEITIREDSIFYDKNIKGVATWVGIEYISQAIAALAGIHATIECRSIRLGFLLGTRKYHTYQKVFKRNMTYSIIVAQLYKDDSGLASFECKILEKSEGLEKFTNDMICVQTKLNVFETDDFERLK